MPPPRQPRRPRRFVMPAEHHDVRTSEGIEAFIEGPARPARKVPRPGQRRSHRPIVFDTPATWRDGLRREEIRIGRYGRRATVMVVDVAVRPGGATDGNHASRPESSTIEPVVDAIRHEARETDRVLRVSATRFHALLPETGEAEADHLADRLRTACRDRLNGHGGLIHLRVEFTTPGHGVSLADAIADAERRLEG